MENNDIGTKVFRVHAPEDNKRISVFFPTHIKLVVSKLREWYEDGCTDMYDACVMVFSEHGEDGYRDPISLNMSSAPM
jgi:hypothetical protein